MAATEDNDINYVKAVKNRRKEDRSDRRRESGIFKVFRWGMYYLVAIPVLSMFNYVFLGLRIQGRQNMDGIRCGVVVCNHIHPLDATMAACGSIPHRLNVAVLNKNMEKPIAGKIVTIFGTPVGVNLSGHKRFIERTTIRLIAGEWFLVFPEGEMILYDTSIRPFKHGAFLLAFKADVPIVPMVLVQRPVSGIRSFLRNKPLFTLKIGNPIVPHRGMDEKQNIDYLRDTAMAIMTDMMNEDGRQIEAVISNQVY
ncbi:MAG: lysophospholipid acyltransferase family protein [Saccharofermentanales bacterium]